MPSTPRPDNPAPVHIDVQSTACPLCGAEDHVEVCQVRDATYGIPGSYRVVRCRGCRHMFLNPRPSDHSLMDCYPQQYAPHGTSSPQGLPHPALPTQGAGSRATGGESTPARGRRLLRSIPGLRRLLYWLGQEWATYLPTPALPQQSRLLEIGCAHGSFLQRAAEAGWLVDGVEPSQAAAARARQQGLQVFCGRLSEAQLPSASRDCVALWMVLEHVPDPRELLVEIRRILTADGLLTLSVPNAGSWERQLFGRYWLGYDAPRHLQMFTAQRLQQLLVEIGYQDIRIMYQANTRYWWGSLAAWGAERFPRQAWPQRWMGYFTSEPPAWCRWLSLLPGQAVSLCRCSGRITVLARKPA